MSDYRVELVNYCGPLDLLLFLVKRHEIDLQDIPIAELADQYLAHLEQMRRIDINLAGEFLVMASTLLEIKSQMLAPREEDEAEGDKPEADDQGMSALDPRYELVQQLLAYKAFKDAANELDDRRLTWSQRFAVVPRKTRRAQANEGQADDPDAPPMIEVDLDDVGLNDLTEAFTRILETVGSGPREHSVVSDDTPIGLHQADIVDRLQRDGAMSLAAVFEGRTRNDMIGLFLATLELVRQRKLRVFQDAINGEIRMELRADADAAVQGDDAMDVTPSEVEGGAGPGEGDGAGEGSDGAKDDPFARWRNPETGEVEYDWPSEKDRRRAERRAAMRAKRAAQFRGGAEGDDIDDDNDDEGDDDAGEEDRAADEEAFVIDDSIASDADADADVEVDADADVDSDGADDAAENAAESPSGGAADEADGEDGAADERRPGAG